MNRKLPALPSSIRVGPFDVAVVDWHPKAAQASNAFGEFSNPEQEIRVDTTHHRQKVVDTMIHEVTHAIFWAYGLRGEDKEEQLVTVMATAWTQIYQDNPHFLVWVQRMLK